MSESIRKLNENPVTALADTDYIVACDSAGNLSPIKKADFIKGISVGGRNLVKNSHISKEGQYHLSDCFVTEPLKPGTYYTISIYGASLGEGKGSFTLWDYAGMNKIANLQPIGNGIYSTTFIIPESISLSEFAKFRMFAIPQSVTTASSFSHIKIERGTISTDWSPAPEDILDRLTALENRGGVIALYPTTCNQQEKGGRHEREYQRAYQRVSERDYDGCDGKQRVLFQYRRMQGSGILSWPGGRVFGNISTNRLGLVVWLAGGITGTIPTNNPTHHLRKRGCGHESVGHQVVCLEDTYLIIHRKEAVAA